MSKFASFDIAMDKIEDARVSSEGISIEIEQRHAAGIIFDIIDGLDQFYKDSAVETMLTMIDSEAIADFLSSRGYKVTDGE